MPRHLQVYIHNDVNLFGSVAVDAGKERKKIKLILNDMPKGIITITITDTLGRPFAERLFFAHFFKKPSIVVSTDTSRYGRHAKVTLKLKLADFENNSLTGVVSIACVQANRITNVSRNDIETYVYLKHFSANIPPLMGREIDNEVYMENVLLIKGWRRYTWQTLMKATPEDSFGNLQSIPITGRTYIEKKLPKKPVELIIIRDSSLDLFSTDGKGRFALNPISISVKEGRKVFISVNNNTYRIGNNSEIKMPDDIDNFIPASAYKNMHNIKIDDEMKFIIEIDNPLKTILNNLIPYFNFNKAATSASYLNYKAAVEREIPGVKRLKEVVVISKKDNLIYGKLGNEWGPNACGDYVCEYDILNCINHINDINNHFPVKGKSYWTNPLRERQQPYYGCDLTNKQTAINIPAIYLTREFYGVEQKQKDIAVPEYLSTIFWKPGVIINTQKEVEFSFYTSDVTGKFKVIIQGVTDNKDVVYKEVSFTVTN